MASVIFSKNELILGLQTKIHFINIETTSVTRSIKIPEVLPKSKNGEKDEDDQSSKKSDKGPAASIIQQIGISSNGELLAVTTCGEKCLLLYKISENSAELISVRNLVRVSSALSFFRDSSKLLVSDKTGDCYVFDLVDHTAPGKWILGHLSIVMDVCCSPDERFVITCDRDEKIKVTNFPDTHEIESYCLGHKEYVSSIQLLPFDPDTYLLSVSGDKTMKIWKYKRGIQVHEIQMPGPGVKASLRRINENDCHVAVLLLQPEENIHVYELKFTEGVFESRPLTKHCWAPATVSNLCYAGSDLCVALARDNTLHLEVVEGALSENRDRLKALVQDLFKDDKICELDDPSLWFKKKFDNVSEYLERKKRRIEEKNSR